MKRLLLLLSLLMARPATAEPLVLVSDVPEMEGRQAQRPLWAPGDQPRLVHEMTDRNASSDREPRMT